MSFDWSWWKQSGLSAVQTASHTVSGIFIGDAVNLWDLDYKTIFGLAAAAAVGSALRSIDAYRLPGKPTEEPAPAPEVAAFSDHGPGK